MYNEHPSSGARLQFGKLSELKGLLEVPIRIVRIRAAGEVYQSQSGQINSCRKVLLNCH